MTEKDLERMLATGAFRLRVENALCAAIAALGMAMLAGAAVVVSVRYWVLPSPLILMSILAIPFTALVLGALSFKLHRPAP